MITQPEPGVFESTNPAGQEARYAGNLKSMYSGAVLWIFEELRHVYCQSTEGQKWDLHCQLLSLKKRFSQVGIDTLSPYSQEVVGNHLLPLLPAALPAVCVQLYLLL